MALITRSLSRASLGPYPLQAAIAAVHAEALRPQDTDWPQILELYGRLERAGDNPNVTLNRAVAVAMVRGPEDGLEVIGELESDSELAGHYRLEAVRAHLLEMAGRTDEAIEGYQRPARLTRSEPERRYLESRCARLGS